MHSSYCPCCGLGHCAHRSAGRGPRTNNQPTERLCHLEPCQTDRETEDKSSQGLSGAHSVTTILSHTVGAVTLPRTGSANTQKR
jgi:hypothetical protein